MTLIICTFVFIIAYILFVVWLCNLIMKPVKTSFESGFSISDSAHRLSMICMPFNASTLVFQWVFGSATATNVTLECRTRGVKRSFSQFNGKFISDGSKVVLKGEFKMAPGAKMSMIFWLTLLVLSLILVTRKLVVDYAPGMLGLFIFICALICFAFWVMKIRVSEYPGEVKFISTSIENALRAM